MNREEARQYIIGRGKEHLTPDHSRKGYICPVCGSGSGKHGTGITTKDGVHFTCWAGCFTNADIIDIIGLEHRLTDYNSKLQTAAAEFGITVESYHRSTPQEDFAPVGEYQKQAKSERNTQDTIHNTAYTKEGEAERDYTSFFLQANQDIEKTSYHRGLTLETLNRFKVGYVESWTHPKAPKMTPSPRLIVPTSKHSYLARHASESDYINYRGQVENKSKVGKVRIFNSRALREAKSPIFIVEGEIDALSIIDVGGEAVALGSTANKRALLSMLETQKPAQPLVIAMDNDGAGETANKELAEGLERLEIPFYRLDIAQPYKDANEALNADREAFRETIYRAMETVEEGEAGKLEAEREALKREAVAYSLQDFLKNIEDSKRAAFIPTGFSPLDNLLDGGLYAGLYVVGAISSLGKTTFTLQICDQVAAAGHDVLVFSLEMARNELIAKSISRLTLIKDLEENNSTANAKTTRGILTGTRYAEYNQTERELIQRSIAAYGEYARNIYISEGMGNIGVEQIREKVQKHIKITGKAPVVLIDYLQIIAPADMRATDKQNTDKAVLELKRLSRDYGIPVIGISSFNRDNYTAPVNLASFKESGAIEYSSDVLIGLQYEGMDYQEDETDKAREKRIRELMKQTVEDGKHGKAQSIQVKILKNRNGSKGDTLLDFYPMFNYFTAKKLTAGATSGGNSDSWSKSESGYSTTTGKQKKSKREQERERLSMAFYKVQGDDFKADLTALADELDKSKKQVLNLIAEYGGYVVIGDTVELDRSKDTIASPQFVELDEQEEIPW
jgi:replicative DNA helicase